MDFILKDSEVVMFHPFSSLWAPIISQRPCSERNSMGWTAALIYCHEVARNWLVFLRGTAVRPLLPLIKQPRALKGVNAKVVLVII